MSNRLLYGLVSLIVAIIFGLLVLNIYLQGTKDVTAPFGKGNVRGISLVRNGIPYTLNFKQQKTLLHHLNYGVEASEERSKTIDNNLLIEQVVVHRFDRPDTFLTPVDFTGANYTFQSSDSSIKGLLMETSMGQLNELFEEATLP